MKWLLSLSSIESLSRTKAVVVTKCRQNFEQSVFNQIHTINICDQIWEKGALRAFPKSSSYYTRCKSRALPTSGVGGARPALITFKNHHFMALFGGSPLRAGGLLRLLTLDLWSRRPKLLTNQVWSLGLSLPWNGGKLKSDKKSRFVRSAPLSQIRSHIIISPMAPCFRRINQVCSS